MSSETRTMASTTTKSAGAKGGGGSGGAEEAPKKGRKKLLAIVGVLVIGGGAAGYTFFGPGKSAEAADEKPPPPELGDVLVIDPISINLADGHYLKLGLGLQAIAATEHPPEGSRALDAAIALYSGRSMEELSNPDERAKLKDELTTTIEEDYHEDVVDVYFREYVMQ